MNVPRNCRNTCGHVCLYSNIVEPCKPRRWMPMRLWFHGFNLHLSPLQLTIIVAYLLLVVMMWSWWGHVWQPRHFFLKMRTYETSILVSRAILKLSNSMQNYKDCQHKWKMLPLWLDRIFLADVKWRGEHYHSEKLTTAFGLVGKSFVVLHYELSRMCKVCGVYRVDYENWFHHFEDGGFSC
jgi:hypothetical protein